MYVKRYYQRGAATLVGVLIAMVVAGVGLYALMQTQGEMTSGISASKARAQAKELAQLKIQELHAYIEKNQFTSDLPLTPLDELVWDVTQPDYTHENLAVNVDKIYEEWLIRRAGCVKDSTDAWCSDLAVKNPNGNYLEVMVRESWTDQAGNPHSVSLNNFIVFKDPAIISGIWEDETGGSSERWGRTRMNVGIERAEGDTTQVGSGTEIITSTDTAVDSGSVNLGLNSNGNWEIYLGGTRSIQNVVLTAFGGIIHQIRGKIHIEDTDIAQVNLDEMAAIATSPAYCEYPVYSDECPLGLTHECVEYVCFVPGDCANETDFTSTNPYYPANADCQEGETGTLTGTNLTDHLADIKSLELNGGWYGKVGLFGVPTSPFDDIITGDSCDDPARLYSSLRLCDSGDDECAFLEPPIEVPTKFPEFCEYQKDCTFQDPTDEDPSNYTGYTSHCVGNPKTEEILDGYCINGTPYGIYENEGINGSYTNNHFWLIDKDVNSKTCEELRVRFSESGSIPNDPEPIPPPYLVDHNLVRSLPVDANGDEPINNITALNNGNADINDLDSRYSPP